ncbi:heterokaryon incompatibility protein-domain-containing protein [Fomes fomentarius]|nr:heterokaryon incompatibility protein-domain-containing protein [Fomes fomentarius]
MRLLSTHRAELRYFTDHTVIPGGYAILSHTWGPKEQTLQDVHAIGAECVQHGWNPRDHVSEKIRGSCMLAEKDGYDWIWIDSCCIDKTSSSELSEAINSMFEWYLRSEVCYALLEDVPSNCDLDAPQSEFRNARWHTRGWTLQELIAPSIVIFLSSDWTFLGTKAELADLLQEITGIFSRILMHQRHYSDLSVARRMSWASRRRTTRLEDEAYCLMGLFGVNMPTIYGEGHKAFRRLQEVILKQTSDMSLFAWSAAQPLDTLGEPATPSQIRQASAFAPSHMSFFAQSPGVFREPSYVAYSPTLNNPLQPYLPSQWKVEHNDPEDSSRRTHGPFGGLELPKVTVNTSTAVECRLPVFELDGMTVAILFCEDGRSHLGLLLHPSPAPIQDPKRLLYRPGYGFSTDHGSVYLQRLVALGSDYYNMILRGKKVTAEWRDIAIEQNDVYQDDRYLIRIYGRLNGIGPSRSLPFHVPNWLLMRFRALEFEVFSLVAEGHGEFPGTSGRPLSLLFKHTASHESLRFNLGTCMSMSPSVKDAPDSGKPSLSHWARVDIEHMGNLGRNPPGLSHNCADDHIADWQNWAKEFGDADRTVRLSFTRSTIIPRMDTLVMHVELDGHRYREISETLNVPLSSLNLAREPELPSAPLPNSMPVPVSPDSHSAKPMPVASGSSARGSFGLTWCLCQ